MNPMIQGPPVPPGAMVPPTAGPEAAMSMMSQQAPAPDGAQQMAMSYIEAAKELWMAAVNDMPELAPYLERAGEIIEIGIEAIQAGRTMPSSPPAMGPPSMPQAPAGPGGAIPGTSPENIVLTP